MGTFFLTTQGGRNQCICMEAPTRPTVALTWGAPPPPPHQAQKTGLSMWTTQEERAPKWPRLKNLPAVQETQVQPLGQEDPSEKGMANHSRILA